MPERAATWIIAAGGTRRAYIADGGRLEKREDLPGYFSWAEGVHRAMLEHVYALGVQSIIVSARLPTDRGPDYLMLAQRLMRDLVLGEVRRSWYAREQLRVRVAGDLDAIAEALQLDRQGIDELHTATAAGNRTLVYLFRGAWVDPAVEEAQWGYRLGQELKRMPSREELATAFYGVDLPPLQVAVGSGRPRYALLKAPFLAGTAECFWSANSPLRLSRADWARIAEELQARRTEGGRSYEGIDQALLREEVVRRDGVIVGLGEQRLGMCFPATG